MEYSSSYEIKVIVCGRELTHEEQLKKDIFYEIKCAQSDYNSDYVELPKEVDGEEVIYKRMRDYRTGLYCVTKCCKARNYRLF